MAASLPSEQAGMGDGPPPEAPGPQGRNGGRSAPVPGEVGRGLALARQMAGVSGDSWANPQGAPPYELMRDLERNGR